MIRAPPRAIRLHSSRARIPHQARGWWYPSLFLSRDSQLTRHGVRLFMTSTVGRRTYLVHLCPTCRAYVLDRTTGDASTRSIYLGCALRRAWREDRETRVALAVSGGSGGNVVALGRTAVREAYADAGVRAGLALAVLLPSVCARPRRRWWTAAWSRGRDALEVRPHQECK
ncbi:hypothetical protein B0H14DRAFT_3894042 [Mycena olivaceomarginata]|nr:hypothetical protein B0H14DRAFT_3894042 [Mycena olivaceomarginata]